MNVEYLMQWKPLSEICLGLRKTDHIIQMITISESTPYTYYLIK